jgi:hypothetical protein
MSNIDKNSQYIKQIRADLYLHIQRKLLYLKEHIRLVNNSSLVYDKLFRQIQFLEQISKNLCSYQDESLKILIIEYGVSKNQNLGIQFLYKENRFQGSSNIKYLSDNSEISVFYKKMIFQNDKRIITIQPKIYITQNRDHHLQFSYELLLLSAISKQIFLFSVFAESAFGFGQNLNNPNKKKHYYSLSTSEGIKFKNGIMLVSFTKYYIRRNYGNIYHKTLYKQLSIVKNIKINNLRYNNITTQIGYFWDQSLINKNYKIHL